MQPNQDLLGNKWRFLINPLRNAARRVDIFLCLDQFKPSRGSQEGLTFFNAAVVSISNLPDCKDPSCGAQFERFELCLSEVTRFEMENGLEYDWFIRDRPDTIFFSRIPNVSTLQPDKVHAPARYARSKSFRDLCSTESIERRRAVGAWEPCSEANEWFREDPDRSCIAIGDEFAMVPRRLRAAYFRNTWKGMDSERVAAPWGPLETDLITQRFGCFFWRDDLKAPHRSKWNNEGVLTRQLIASAPDSIEILNLTYRLDACRRVPLRRGLRLEDILTPQKLKQCHQDVLV